MIMRRILIIAWCIKFSIAHPLSPEIHGFNIDLKDISDFSQQWPFPSSESNGIFEKSNQTPSSQIQKEKFSKTESAYSHSESYESDDLQKQTIPDSRLLYHSLKNPLFQSRSLNLESSGNSIHSISNPFQSKWLLLPASKVIEKRKIPNLDTLLNKEIESFNVSTNPGGLKLNLLNNLTLGNSSILGNASFLSSNTKFDALKNFGGSFPSLQKLVTSTSTTTTPQPNSKKSFYGYNFKEVKTGDGKTHGVVQVFDANGLKENIEYNEKGVVNKTSNITNKNNSTQNKVQPVADSIESSKTFSTNPTFSDFTFQSNSFGDTPFKRDAITYNQPEISEFPSPELILFDFLGRLQSAPSSINHRGNLFSDELTTFDESVNGNSFFYND